MRDGRRIRTPRGVDCYRIHQRATNGSHTTTCFKTRHAEALVITTANPELLTVDEVASLLRTSRKAVYAMVERRQLPGVRRVGRRVLVRRVELLDWLDHNCAPSLERTQR